MGDAKTLDRLALGRVLAALGRTWEAEEVAHAMLDLDSDNVEALSLLAKLKHVRGELSQAIGLWATIHARAAHSNEALPKLDVLRRLAESPERAAGEFVALGDGRMVRKHLAQIELERAFDLLRQGRVADAESACEAVALRHRKGDREVYKLAVLARIWIRELAGNLHGARAAVEQLGTERGFETDPDRLQFLVRIYEKIGRPEDLRAAINVYVHLRDRFGRLSAHAHLARLYAKVGDTAAAEASAHRYLVAFRRRMHRPTQDDLPRAASVRYVPLDSLAKIETVESDPSEPPLDAPLAIAVRDALTGDVAVAESRLEGLGSPGLAYLGDLAAQRNDVELAVARWEAALDRVPPDVGVVRRLCDVEAGYASLERLARRPAWLEAAIAALLEVARNEPEEPAHWRRLAALERAGGRLPDAERHVAKACALEEAGPARRRPGRVLAAAVYRFLGKAKGLIHELWADRHPVARSRGGALEPNELFGNVAPDFAVNVRNTFVATRQYTKTKFPHLCRDLDDYVYSFKVTKDDEPSGGLSAGLPTAVAFVSIFTGRPVPGDVALSGAIVADAHNVLAVRNVADIEIKVKGAYNRDLRCLVLPAESRADLERSSVVPREISTDIVRYARTLDEALEHVFGVGVWEW